MSAFNGLSSVIHISQLNFAQAKELQQSLNNHGFNLSVDGIIGPKTTQALIKFKDDSFLGYPEFIGTTTLEALRRVQKTNNSYDFSTKEGTIEAIKKECRKQGLTLKTQIAYVIATAQWETANTFKPVKEAYWLSEGWRRKNLRYFPFYG
jgi:peptidoglycan hydrolase-like protein with peptidoglycan-binding domain